MPNPLTSLPTQRETPGSHFQRSRFQGSLSLRGAEASQELHRLLLEPSAPPRACTRHPPHGGQRPATAWPQGRRPVALTIWGRPAELRDAGGPGCVSAVAGSPWGWAGPWQLTQIPDMAASKPDPYTNIFFSGHQTCVHMY